MDKGLKNIRHDIPVFILESPTKSLIFFFLNNFIFTRLDDRFFDD